MDASLLAQKHLDFATLQLQEQPTLPIFSSTSAISIVDSIGSDSIRFDKINAHTYAASFKSPPRLSVKERAVFIPLIHTSKAMNITSSLFFQICKDYAIPETFVQSILETNKFPTPGYGYFTAGDDPKTPDTICIYYKFVGAFTSGKGFIFSRFDLQRDNIFHLCINMDYCLDIWSNQVAKIRAFPKARSLIGMHVLLMQRINQGLTNDAVEERPKLTTNEPGHGPQYDLKTQPLPNSQSDMSLKSKNPQKQIVYFHELARKFHILSENFANLEQAIQFLHSTLDKLSKTETPIQRNAIATEAQLLDQILSACLHSKRWVLNYRDRTSIRINLAFHLSQQADNEINLGISNATASIAKDAHRDNSALITISIVTLFFLPGTLISAVFSMVFFTNDPDSRGDDILHISKNIWWYFAITIPITAIVFIVWIYWKTKRFKKHSMELNNYANLTHKGHNVR